MSWAEIYLICFIAGVGFSVITFLAGSVHLHWPHFHVGGAHAHPAGGAKGGIGPVNIGTIAAFLAWFGAAGYLMTGYYRVWFLAGLIVALLCGLAGAVIVFLFLAKVLNRGGETLDPSDYNMIGVLGTVSSSIRPEGTGEMIFSQAGARRAAPVRSESGTAIARGAEVVVTRYESGIAYVRPWDELDRSSAENKECV